MTFLRKCGFFAWFVGLTACLIADLISNTQGRLVIPLTSIFVYESFLWCWLTKTNRERLLQVISSIPTQYRVAINFILVGGAIGFAFSSFSGTAFTLLNTLILTPMIAALIFITFYELPRVTESALLFLALGILGAYYWSTSRGIALTREVVAATVTPALVLVTLRSKRTARQATIDTIIFLIIFCLTIFQLSLAPLISLLIVFLVYRSQYFRNEQARNITALGLLGIGVGLMLVFLPLPARSGTSSFLHLWPVTGVGLGGWEKTIAQNHFLIDQDHLPLGSLNLANSFDWLWANLGFLGLLGTTVLIITVFNRKDFASPIHLALITLLFQGLANPLFDNQLIAMTIWIYLAGGFLVVNNSVNVANEIL